MLPIVFIFHGLFDNLSNIYTCINYAWKVETVEFLNAFLVQEQQLLTLYFLTNLTYGKIILLNWTEYGTQRSYSLW